MESRKIIGIITDYCDVHAVYTAMFPSPDGHGVVLVEGPINALSLESQAMIEVGASIIAEVTDGGEVLNVFCPPVETLGTGFSSKQTEEWLEMVRERAGIKKDEG